MNPITSHELEQHRLNLRLAENPPPFEHHVIEILNNALFNANGTCIALDTINIYPPFAEKLAYLDEIKQEYTFRKVYFEYRYNGFPAPIPDNVAYMSVELMVSEIPFYLNSHNIVARY